MLNYKYIWKPRVHILISFLKLFYHRANCICAKGGGGGIGNGWKGKNSGGSALQGFPSEAVAILDERKKAAAKRLQNTTKYFKILDEIERAAAKILLKMFQQVCLRSSELNVSTTIYSFAIFQEETCHDYSPEEIFACIKDFS